MKKYTGATTGHMPKPSHSATPVRGSEVGDKGLPGTESTAHNGTNSGKKS